jgi:hypothetical protein
LHAAGFVACAAGSALPRDACGAHAARAPAAALRLRCALRCVRLLRCAAFAPASHAAAPRVPPPRLTQRTRAGIFIYLTVQVLTLCALYYSASAAAALARWAAPQSAPAQRLTAAVHAAAPLLWALSLFVALAFYAVIWRDPVFQAAAVAPKARAAPLSLKCSAPLDAPHARNGALPQVALGLPVKEWLHETHAGPAALAILDLAGSKDASLLGRHLLPARALATAAAAAAAAYFGGVAAAAAAPGGAWPYEFMAAMSAGMRVAFAAAAAAVLILLTLLARGAAAWRATRAAAPPPAEPAAAAAAVPPPPAADATPRARRAKRAA